MMRLKDYQCAVLEDLEGFLDAWERTGDPNAAWKVHWARKGGTEEAYRDSLHGVPSVCVKVPTGGGKTFLAACALKRIFRRMPPDQPRLVLWLVPSEAILSQTLRNLGNPDHPYRRQLEGDFGEVHVLDKAQLLAGQSFSPGEVAETLTVGVLCYASVRVDPTKAEDRKIYQENGHLRAFAESTREEGALLPGTDETALIQALRGLRPVVVVDESHNAGSRLSREMLANLNPSFALSLTATPRPEENIVSMVTARALKAENMVKLPVIVYRRASRGEVFRNAIALREKLESFAEAERAAGGARIRPIVLFLAEPKRAGDPATFGKIKERLLAAGIPEAQVAIKTAQKDELKGVDLMAEGCPVRYVVTVNALREGWDCPFAYVLASLSNRSSKTEVEQVLGRVLRQPAAVKHRQEMLNWAYVLSCSGDFQKTVESVVNGLKGAGFSGRDWRDASGEDATDGPPRDGQETIEYSPRGDAVREGGPSAAEGESDDFGDLEPAPEVRYGGGETAEEAAVSALERCALDQGRQYEAESANEEEMDMGGIKCRRIKAEFRETVLRLKVPQFVVADDGLGIFGGGGGMRPLRLSDLAEDFSLAAQDATIPFNTAPSDAFLVDVEEREGAGPGYRRLSRQQQELFARQLAGAADETSRLRKIAAQVAHLLDGGDACTGKGLLEYATRALEALPAARRQEIGPESVSAFTDAVRTKIDGLLRKWRREAFQRRLAANEVLCKPAWAFPGTIAPGRPLQALGKSLYEAEWPVDNGEEWDLATRIAAAESVLWWHRVVPRQGFCINGWRNHYPDFMVMTKNGTLVLVEAKGGFLNGSDSAEKCELGRKWADLAGDACKYFMVFKEGEKGVPGAVGTADFLNALERL